MFIDPLIVTAISIGLGLMFVAAGLHKLSRISAFEVTLIEYQLLPGWAVRLAARVVPIVEILLGGSWLIGYYSTGTTVILSAALLGVYALAITINIARGRIHFDCGCGFGGKRENEQYLSSGLVLRNVVLIGLALATLLPTTDRTLALADYVVVLASLSAGALLFASVNQLLANRSAINTWRQPGG